ncbi:MAG TPA: hypothetical protein VGO57_09515 [Verrucomicrobiae bacterium]|jgi:hypothetical protein
MKSGMKAPRYWNRRTVVRPLGIRLRDRRNWRAMVHRRHLIGLTTRGTKFKRVEFGPQIIDRLDRIAGRMNVVFPQMPRSVQLEWLNLAKDIAALKRNLA